MVLLVHSFFIQLLPLVFFFYGLAHFSMGLAILLEVRKSSQLMLVKILPLLAAFGIIHGFSEWLDGVPFITGNPSSFSLNGFRLLTLIISAAFLLFFGSELIGRQKKRTWIRILPLFFIFAWLVLTSVFFNENFRLFFVNARIICFYLVYLPGTILSGIGFIIQYKKLKGQKYVRIAYNFFIVAILFFSLGFFEGIIVPKSFFFPASFLNELAFQRLLAVQAELIRGILAVLIAVFLIMGLRIFEAESERRIAFLEEKRRLMDVLQESLLKTKVPDIKSLDIAYHYESATVEAAIGGDFYDFIDLGNGRYLFVVGDVSGKGIGVAADAFMTDQAVRCLAHEYKQPKDIMARVNNILTEQTTGGNFVTMTLLLFDSKEDNLIYTSAGHPYPILCSKKRCDFLTISGSALGNFSNEDYEQENVDFNKGDCLVLYTDGLVEAKRSGELYSDSKLKDLISANRNLSAQQLVDLIMADVRVFSEGKLGDDIVVIAIKYG